METMTMKITKDILFKIIAQLRRDGNYDRSRKNIFAIEDHSTTKTGWKL